MSRERPSDFAKLYAGIMPREFWVESVATALADDELDRMIEMLRERALAAQEEQQLAPPLKAISHAEGRLFTERLAPGDNAEHVARKLLREKHGKHSSFYDPIKYPASYH
jgi:F420-0:gamma-glutamyl ligase